MPDEKISTVHLKISDKIWDKFTMQTKNEGLMIIPLASKILSEALKKHIQKETN